MKPARARIAIVSDIHANLVALEAVLSAIGQADAVWCLGDTVGYGPEPSACVLAVRDRMHAAVAGNHDWAAIGKLGTEDFNVHAAIAARWTAAALNAEAHRYLELLPLRRVEGDFTLVHGSPRDPVWEYLLDARVAARCFEHYQTRFCLVGHTHVPSFFVQTPDGAEAHYAEPDTSLDLGGKDRLMLNPGSVGQPRDGNPQASYLLIDTQRHSATWRRVEYDVEATQRTMRAHGLPKLLSERLAVGK